MALAHKEDGANINIDISTKIQYTMVLLSYTMDFLIVFTSSYNTKYDQNLAMLAESLTDPIKQRLSDSLAMFAGSLADPIKQNYD